MDGIVGIVIGFALTTVAGGWWASRLQQRSWERQNDVRLREAEAERAGATCQGLMQLLDRRLYRMQRLLWAAAEGDAEEIEHRRGEYVEVLLSWNDALNTNLSLVGSYFGDGARGYLEGLYEDFKRVGQGVEAVVRAAREGGNAAELVSQVGPEFEGREVGSLNERVYQIGVMLMSQLREGQVGRYAPDKASPRRGS